MPTTQLHPDVRDQIEKWRDQVTTAAGENLVALLLYGGLARGRYRAVRSDVNVLLVVRNASPDALEPLLQPLRRGYASLQIEPMILTPSEIPAAMQSFPVKFHDIQKCHLLLAGKNPFVGLSISNERIAWAVAQSLRNIAMRMRRRYIAIAGDETATFHAMVEMARPLAINLLALLELAGEPAPAQDTSAEIFAAAAKRFSLDAGALSQLAELRRDLTLEADAADLYQRVLQSVLQAADAAGAHPGGAR